MDDAPVTNPSAPRIASQKSYFVQVPFELNRREYDIESEHSRGTRGCCPHVQDRLPNARNTVGAYQQRGNVDLGSHLSRR